MMLTPLVEETLKAAPLLLRPVWKMVTSRMSALWVGFVLGVSFGLGEAAFLAYGIAQAGVYNLSWLLRSSARLLKAKQVERVILIGYHAVLSYPNYITHWEQFDNNIFVWKPFLFRLQQRIKHWTKPAALSLIAGVLSDLTRSRADLIIENALLHQQMIVLHRQVKRPLFTNRDRIRLVLLTRCTRF
jgi:hypothetical protein